ncbi:MAG: sulfatase [Phycisphaerae bacterium]
MNGVPHLQYILLAVLATLASACRASQDTSEPGPSSPSIVLILVDDMGYGDLSCYGQSRWKTPNLDRLAAAGVRLTDFYSAQAVCSASRAALLTGCYPNRLHIAGALGPRSKVGLHPDETTIAELCKARGYATAIYGKWHLGDAPNLLPTRQGFDEWCGIPYSNDMWPLHPDLVRLPPESDARKRGYPPLPLYENGAIIDPEITPDEQKGLTKLFTDRACAFIEKHSEHPFFVYVPFPMPHVPLFVSPQFEYTSGAGLYGDVIQEIDASVGRIVERIDSLGLGARTLIIFTSDNGPWLSYGNHAGTTGGLREGKGTSWEGGVRAPFVARWTGRLPAGKVIRTPAMTIDLLPTIAAFIGAEGDHAPRIDGSDLSRLLTDGADPSLDDRALAFYYNANDLEAVRMGQWKLVLPHQYRTLAGDAGKDGSPGPYKQVRSGLELYDLLTDPHESDDVADAHPEVLARFQPVLERFRADLGDDLTKRQGSGRREAGRSQPVEGTK